MQKAWLPNHIALTGFLGRTLGPDYEIALYDLTEPAAAVVAIANGHVTQRTLGAPLPPLLGQWLDEPRDEQPEEWIQLADMTATGKLLRTSARVVTDEARRRAGLLTISFDDSRYRDLSERILRLRHPDSFVDSHFVSQALEDVSAAGEMPPRPSAASGRGLAADILARARAELNEEPGRLRHRERLKWVGGLDARGFFGVKGAVGLLAEELGCSPATVYRYLSAVRAAG